MAATNFVSYMGSSGEASHDLAFPNSVQTDSVLVVFIVMWLSPNAPTISTPTVASGPNAGITFSPIEAQTTNPGTPSQASRLYYAKATAAGATTVHVAPNAGSPVMSISMVELTGRHVTTPLDQHNTPATGTGTAVSGSNLTGVATDADVVAVLQDPSGETAAYTPPATFTVNANSERDAGDVGIRLSLAYKNATSGNISPTWTIPGSGGAWVTQSASFIPSATPPPDPPPASGVPAPTGLAAQSRPGEVRLVWNAVSASPAAFAYEIRRSTVSGGPYAALPVGEFEASVTQGLRWIDPDVTNGTTYYYVVRTRNVNGDLSPYSGQVSCTPVWPTWTERGWGSDLQTLITNDVTGTVTLSDGIWRIRDDGDVPAINKALVLKPTTPGRVEITASRNWVTGGEAGCTWSGTGPWTSSLASPAMTANEAGGAESGPDNFHAYTYLQIVGYTSNGTATEFLRVASSSTPGAGQWAYVADGSDLHIRLGSDPAGFQRIEVGTNAHRWLTVGPSSAGITVQDIRFLHIGGGTRDSVLGNNGGGVTCHNVTFQDCTVGFSHAGGFHFGSFPADPGADNIVIRRNYLHHCCHIGFVMGGDGSGDGFLVEYNRADWVGYNWYSSEWESAVSKFVGAHGAYGQFNVRYNEWGRSTQGLFAYWSDIRGDNPHIYGNRFQAYASALHFEISAGGISEFNAILQFASSVTGYPTLYFSSSQDHTARDNLVVAPGAGIGISMWAEASRNDTAKTGNVELRNTVVKRGAGSNYLERHNSSTVGTIDQEQYYTSGGAGSSWMANGTPYGDLASFNAATNIGTNSIIDQPTAELLMKMWGVMVDNTVIQATITTPIRVDCGSSSSYVDSYGYTWAADPGPSSGSGTALARPGTAIGGTFDDTLFQTEVYGDTFGYVYLVADGWYDVRLRFAELLYIAVGARLFNVAINGVAKLTNFDIFAEVGHDVATDRTFTVQATGGLGLTIAFTNVVGGAKIDAIEIVDYVPTAPPVISNVNSGAPSTGGTTVTWTTDVQASSQVEYGKSAAYGLQTTETDTAPRVTSHSVALTGLDAGTVYHFRVKSTDGSARQTVSGDYMFTTQTEPVEPPPPPAPGPGAPYPAPIGTDRLTYITPDGVEYMLSSPVFVLQEDGYGMPPIEYVTQRGPFQHGETVLDFFLRPRTVQLIIRRSGLNRADFWNMRQMLLDVLRPGRTIIPQPGVLRKYLANNTIRELLVFTSEGPGLPGHSGDVWDEWSVQDTIRFTAFDPVARDPTLRQKAFGATGEPQVFPFTYPITMASFGSSEPIQYAGTWRTYPTITITGPATGAVIRNATTDESLTLSYSVPSAHRAVFDLAYGRKSVLLDDGTNLMGYVTSDSDIGSFHLEPGSNLVQVFASGTSAISSIVLSWYDRYIGF